VYIKENDKQFIDRVGVPFNIADVDHHLLAIATRALPSNNARRHLNTAAAWLKTTIYTATVKLQQHVECNIRAREIKNEITIETKAQLIQTSSKAAVNALIRTTEDGPTDLQGTRIAAIVSVQVQAALKKEAAKKEKGRQHEGHHQPKAQHKKKMENKETKKRKLVLPNWIPARNHTRYTIGMPSRAIANTQHPIAANNTIHTGTYGKTVLPHRNIGIPTTTEPISTCGNTNRERPLQWVRTWTWPELRERSQSTGQRTEIPGMGPQHKTHHDGMWSGHPPTNSRERPRTP
jgi:hypothetical protein